MGGSLTSRPLRFRIDDETEARLRRLLAESRSPVDRTKEEIFLTGLRVLLNGPVPIDTATITSALEAEVRARESDFARTADRIRELRPALDRVLANLATYRQDEGTLNLAIRDLEQRIRRAKAPRPGVERDSRPT